MQEANGLSILEHLDALIDDACQSLRQRGQLVIVRRKQRAAAELGRVMQVLDHRLRDR